MNHLDGERLASYALDATEDLTPNELDHLRQCDECAGELAELRQLITAGARAGDPLVAPSGHVWAAITAELAGDDSGPTAR